MNVLCFFFYSHNGNTLLIRVSPNRDALTNMSQPDLALLARKSFIVVQGTQSSYDSTEKEVGALIGNRTAEEANGTARSDFRVNV